MSRITDNELILYFYRDAIDPLRCQQIEQALADDAALRQRYDLLCLTLRASELEQPPEPKEDLVERVWQSVQAGASTARVSGEFIARARTTRVARRRRTALRWVSGIAAAVLLSVSFLAGRVTAPESMLGDRVLDAYIATHLGETRQALLTAVNSDSELLEQANADLAQGLIINNRLYLMAAQRSGDARLVDLLQSLEPILIELANPAVGDDIQSRKGLSEFVQRSDLIFQVRATEAGLRARTSPTI